MSRFQLQTAFPKLTEAFSSSSSSSSLETNGDASLRGGEGVLSRGARLVTSAMGDFASSFFDDGFGGSGFFNRKKSAAFPSSSSSCDVVVGGGERWFFTVSPDAALLSASAVFGLCALVLSVSILTSRPLLVKKSVARRDGSRVSMEYLKAVRGDFAFGLGLMWVSAVLLISGVAFSTNVSFVTESLREELLACVYSFSANAGFCLLCGNIARLGIIDDRAEKTNLVILGTSVSTLMLVSHLFPKIPEGSGKAGWFCETWSFAWCALALAANLGLNCAVEFRGGFTSLDALYGLASGSGAGMMYFAMVSPLKFGKCFGTALFLTGFALHVLGAVARHSVTRYATTAKEEGEEENDSVSLAKKTE